MITARPEPIGVRCFPVRMDDDSYVVLGRRGANDAGGLRNDGEFTGNVPIAVSREATGDVVRARPVEVVPVARVPLWVPAVTLSLTEDDDLIQVNGEYSFSSAANRRNPYRIAQFWLVIKVDDVEVTPTTHPDQLIETGETGTQIVYWPYANPTVTMEISIYTNSSLAALVATTTQVITPSA